MCARLRNAVHAHPWADTAGFAFHGETSLEADCPISKICYLPAIVRTKAAGAHRLKSNRRTELLQKFKSRSREEGDKGMEILLWLIAATGIGMLIYYFVILLKGEER